MILTLSFSFNVYGQKYKLSCIINKCDTINKIDSLGRKQGVWLEFFDNKSIKTKSIYKDNLLNGTFRSFYSNGNIEVVTNFVSNLKEGDYKAYYSTGVLNYYDFYSKGKLLWRSEYNENGQIAMEEIYYDGKILKLIFFENGIPILAPATK